MDFKTIALVFFSIFIAELGDKTQLAVLGFVCSGRSSLATFIGASLALVVVTLLAVVVGNRLAAWVPISIIKKAAGLLFIGLGVMLFVK